MDCFIKDGRPNVPQLKLARNSSDIEKLSITWKSRDKSYVIQVPAGIFEDMPTIRLSTFRITPGKDVTILVLEDAPVDTYHSVIRPLPTGPGTDTPPEIIVNDEGPLDKRKPTAPGKVQSGKASVKKAPSKQPPAEKAA